MNVSVIFATYNRSDVIRDVLESWKKVDKATKYSYEIICSDDASSDNTVEIIREYMDVLPITVLENEHGGASRARNAALKVAKGEIVIFTGDDIFPTENFVNGHYENYLKFGDKVGTLGRIEWHPDIEMNHLMYHITNVGCEQFGFAGLPPYSKVDFRHFYTSNISVSKKMLDEQPKHFDLTFDRYGFEDIELGYRLHKAGVSFYYDEEIEAFHHHVYNDVDKFCNRQMSAGNQMVVFASLHEEIKENPILGVEPFTEAIHAFAANCGCEISERGKEILAYTEELKARTREIENLLKEEDTTELRAECTTLYRHVFQFYMYFGWAKRLMEDKQIDDSVIAEAIFQFMYPGHMKLYWAGRRRRYIEEWSETQIEHSSHVKVEYPEHAGVSYWLRFDPHDVACVVKNLKAYAVLKNGKKIPLIKVSTNGTGKDGLDFSNQEDPQVHYIGLGKAQVRYVFEMDVFDRDSVRDVIGAKISDEKALKRDYHEKVCQPQKVTIHVKNMSMLPDDIFKETIEEYQAVSWLIFRDNVRVVKDAKEFEFSTNYTYEFWEEPIDNEGFIGVIHSLLAGKCYELDLGEYGNIFLNQTEEKMLEKVRKETPLLSVVIPSYNHEKYIGKAIESVLKQSYKNLELIIIDDGSKDNSIELIKSYKDDRITLIAQENAGAHNAINKGLAMAKGEYLTILNSDDIFHTRRFEIMIKEMQKNNNVGFACSYIQVIDSEGNKLDIKEGWKNLEPWTVPHPEKSFKATDDFKLNLIMTNFPSTTSNFLFTRDLYEKIGGMRNLRFAHDWDFALRAAQVTDCMMVEQPLMEYRVHNTNTISSNRKWMLFEIAWMWATNLERFYGKELFAENDYGSLFTIAESLNLQGNDKAFWMIKVFIDSQKEKGVKNPEEILLDNAELRNQIIDYINE